MKILKIEIVKDLKALKLEKSITLPVVDLTIRNFIFFKKVIRAFPTNGGPTYGGTQILHFDYVDNLGKELEDSVSKQINNFLLQENHDIENK